MRAEFYGATSAGSSPIESRSLATVFAARGPAYVWQRRDWRLAVMAVLAFWALAALVWPLTGAVVPWDSKNHFYPMLRYLGAALAGGELPLWNPYHFSGHPAVADPQSLLFTPTMLLFGWLAPSPSMQLFDAVVFAHFLPGALAMLGLFARRGWRPAGAILGAVIFVLGGSASARLQHTGIIFGYGYFPLAFLLLEQTLDRRSYVVASLLGFVVALMVVGRDQVAFLSSLCLAGVCLHRLWMNERPFTFLRERFGVLVVAGVIAVALLAVPVVLTMQLLATSTRPSIGYGVAAMGSLPPESLATILFGNIFGSLRWTYDYWGPDWHSLTEGTWTDRATNYLFAGTVPALLILWHGVAGGRLLAREFRLFLAIGIAAFVYALGRYTPLFGLVFDNLPGVALYRRPADATFLINFVLAISAGYLVHRFVEDGVPRWEQVKESAASAVLVALAICAVAGAILSGLLFAVRAQQAPAALAEIMIGCGLAAIAACIVVRSSSSPRLRVLVGVGLVAVTAGELVWRNAASALNAEPAERYAVFQKLPPEQAQGLQILKQELAARHERGEWPRVEILGLGGAWQNASMVLGLEDTIGYNPLRLADYEKAIGPGENAVDPNLRQFPSTFRGYRCRLASLLGLEYLLLDRPVERLPRHFPRLSNAKLLFGSGSMWVYRLTPSAPRAYLATRLHPVDSEDVLLHGELPDFDRNDEALVERDQKDGLSGDYGVRDSATDPDPANGSVTITSYQRNSVALDVTTDRNSVLVLHDIYYPGWEVTVDGVTKTVLRANLLFRGVELTAGQHRVEFRFRPLSIDNLVAAAAVLLDRDVAGESVTR